MANRTFLISNLAAALMLLITTAFLTNYGTAVNISMAYLFSVIGVWLGQRLLWRSQDLKEKTWPSGGFLTFFGIVIIFTIGFFVLYISGEPMKSLMGRIIILSISFINGVYLFTHIYFHKKSVPLK
jgi:hypothetical protein